MRTAGGSSGGETSTENVATDGDGAGVGAGVGEDEGEGVGRAAEVHPASSRTAPVVNGSTRIGAFLDEYGTPSD
ncbi:MAG: hypothetical protein A2V85_02650 [Chloroflexi bacterium RBG_16_72_14]|nr:MAG: hypothetical protein A2V85_02650 [Chloroflexi bacterium RBG_16_72_14]